MGTFIRRIILGFAIGLTMGSAFARSPNRRPADNTYKEAKPFTSREAVAGNDMYMDTETFQVGSTSVPTVLKAMDTLGLSEDVDFAWMNKVPHATTLSFVCYSVDCYHWARKSLHTIAVAPARPEAALGLRWHDKAIDDKQTPTLTEEQKIQNLQELRYTAARGN